MIMRPEVFERKPIISGINTFQSLLEYQYLFAREGTCRRCLNCAFVQLRSDLYVGSWYSLQRLLFLLITSLIGLTNDSVLRMLEE